MAAGQFGGGFIGSFGGGPSGAGEGNPTLMEHENVDPAPLDAADDGESNPALRFRCEEDWEKPKRWVVREYAMVTAHRHVCEWDHRRENVKSAREHRENVKSMRELCRVEAEMLNDWPSQMMMGRSGGHYKCNGGRSVQGLWVPGGPDGKIKAQENVDMTNGDKLEGSEFACKHFGPHHAVQEYSMVNMNRLVCVNYDNSNSSISECLDVALQLNERVYEGHQCNGGKRVREPWVSQGYSASMTYTCIDMSEKCKNKKMKKFCGANSYFTNRCKKTCTDCIYPEIIK